jgi:hypothetical protein
MLVALPVVRDSVLDAVLDLEDVVEMKRVIDLSMYLECTM